ncbi:MAG TPA: zincin-like metallopeptidase domain-containing protein [Candidatus Cybelea sp.]|nr:zincin-like metallopeptidase domain-containing protein [Candidatus Cybelea sp.]
MPSVSEIITQTMIKQLEQGVAPWRKPWSTSIPRNLISKKPYRGLNVFWLATQGYGSPYWLTFNQARQLGAHPRQGEKGSLVSFWRLSECAKESRKVRELENKTSVLLRYYRVFNIEQCDSLKALYGDDRKPVRPITECEGIADRMPSAPRIEQNSQAFYRPSADLVGMPSRTCFESPEAYYSTLFHELTHATGHKSRLNRFEENATEHQFASESYSKEELVAEMGAAMLAGIAGISHATLSNSASYLQGWIERLESDSRLIISAASHAQKAADYILGDTWSEGSGS